MLSEIIILVDNQRIFFNRTVWVSWSQTNIPKEHFKFKREFYWKVELLQYNEENKCWTIKVVDYSVANIETFSRQKPSNEIRSLNILPLDWELLEPLLYMHVKARLGSHIIERNPEPINIPIPPAIPERIIPFAMASDSEPVFKKIKISFLENLNDASFSNGYIDFTRHVSEINQKVSFKILNEHLLPEFEDIKNWFQKKIGKKFTVIAAIETQGGKVTSVISTSPEIDNINRELIEVIKEERTLTLIKSLNVEESKSLFSADEIFKQIESSDAEGNVFCQDENDVLSILLAKGNIRNKKNLEYLSGEKQSENYKIKFTLHPHFGFLFLVEGEKYNHFIWELRNSNATYLWSVEKDEQELLQHFERIEQAINGVKCLKRERYKQDYKSGLIDTDLRFCSFDHDNISTDELGGFAKWKHKLETYLL